MKLKRLLGIGAAVAVLHVAAPKMVMQAAQSATIFQDDFAGTTGTNLEAHTATTAGVANGGTWSKYPLVNAGQFVLNAANGATNASSGAIWEISSGVPSSADYDVQADLVFTAGMGGYNFGIAGRVDPSQARGYELVYNNASAAWNIVRVDNGAVLATYAMPFAAGTYRAKLQMRGTALTGYVNGVASLSVTDSTWTAAGRGAMVGASDNAGHATYQSFLVADSISGAPASVTVPVTDANLYAPGWDKNGSTYLSSVNSGQYLKTGFTGTSAALTVDVSPMSGSSIASTNYPYLRYSVDGGQYADVQLASGTSSLTVATGLTARTHTLQVFDLLNYSDDRWTPHNAVRVTGLTLDNGAATAAPTVLSKLVEVWGDSITDNVTAGVNYSLPTPADGTATWADNVAAGLGAELIKVGNPAQGYTVAGSGVPALPTSWASYTTGRSRLTAGKLSPMPDYIIDAEGRNDASATAGTTQTAVTTLLTAQRAAANTSTPIFVLVPFAGAQRTEITAAVAGMADPKIYLIDLGTPAALGLGGGASLTSADGTHPRYSRHGQLGAMVMQAIQAKLTTTSTKRRLQ